MGATAWEHDKWLDDQEAAAEEAERREILRKIRLRPDVPWDSW